MQQRPARILPTLRRRNNRARRIDLRGLILLPAFLITLSGCGGDAPSGPTAKTVPHAGVALKLRCPDEAFRSAISHSARSWATRTGATLTLTASGDDADVDVIPVEEFGLRADRGDLVPVPASLRASDHPYQWSGLLPAYRERLIEWGGQARALPLAGEGLVVVYRTDRLAEPNLIAAYEKRAGAKPHAPATWEEFAALAAAFAEVDGRPSLPAMSGPELADLFFRVAACYDRQPLTDAGLAALGGAAKLSFQHDGQTGDPRLGTPGFAAAADWLAGLAAGKCLATDPSADLADGKAMLGVLSLAQVARLKPPGGEIPPRFAVAALPGTRSSTDEKTGQLVRGGAPNYIPYFGGGRLGVVRAQCKHPEAAFDLLADLGSPTRSLELLSNPALGAGPFRAAHLEQDRLLVWLGYGFDAERSRALVAALQQNVRTEVRNPAYALRGPDAKELDAAAAAELAEVAAGRVSGAEGLKRLRAAWDRIDQKTPAETRLKWRRLAAGLN
ncbi:MAG TPA: extracellular solute-binding protein [Gemmata sp.]|nr:extracellular solute-binding protein [Gemmata sp.]